LQKIYFNQQPTGAVPQVSLILRLNHIRLLISIKNNWNIWSSFWW